MAKTHEVKVPDIGDFKDIPVIEILVVPGDKVAAEDPLVSLESDKATMDVPAPTAGTVLEVKVTVGDKVSEGSLILTLEAADGVDEQIADDSAAGAFKAETAPTREPEEEPGRTAQVDSAPARSSGTGAGRREVRVPDIGDFEEIPVIDVLVSPGDIVATEDPLVSLESDKATMDVPAPGPGTVLDVAVKVGDKVSEGSLILTLQSAEAAGTSDDELREQPTADSKEPTPMREHTATSKAEVAVDVAPAAGADPREPAGLSAEMAKNRDGRGSPTSALIERDGGHKAPAHATPAVRRFARTLGVDLARVTGTGRKGRILGDDVSRFVKDALNGSAGTQAAVGSGLPEMPAVDFSKFGPVESRPLSRIRKLTGSNLRRAWLVVPHVTQHDEADITELETFRKSQGEAAKQRSVRLTLLAFLIKASVAALKQYPTFNASLSPAGENLIVKNYWHIGIAVDTSEGLVVPVIRDADRKSLYELAAEMGNVSERARARKLKPDDMQGASFTISSLGGIGGTFFTPIVNAPEVAILGVSRASMKPVWDGTQFQPRLMLPLSLSYDHRVIDGAAGAHFCAHLGHTLSDIRRLLL